MYFCIKLGRDVNHGKRVDPIHFGGQRSRSQWTVWKYAVNQIQTKPFCASSLNLAHMLTMVNPFDFGGHSSKVNVTKGIIDKCWVRGDATLCVVIFVILSTTSITS